MSKAKGVDIKMHYKILDTAVQKAMDLGFRRFIIYPFGEDGMLLKEILENRYGIKDIVVIDNILGKYNPEIKPLSYIKKL